MSIQRIEVSQILQVKEETGGEHPEAEPVCFWTVARARLENLWRGPPAAGRKSSRGWRSQADTPLEPRQPQRVDTDAPIDENMSGIDRSVQHLLSVKET